MTTKLTFEELELASRLLPTFKDKRNLTTGHENQTFAPIRRRTRHIRLVRLGIAEVKIGPYGVVLSRRGPKWVFGYRENGRILRDEQLAQRLEIGAWLRQWFPGTGGPPQKRSETAPSRFSNVIPFGQK